MYLLNCCVESLLVWLTPEAERLLSGEEDMGFLYFEQEYTKDGAKRFYVETTIMPVREDESVRNFGTIVEDGQILHMPNTRYTFSIDTRKPHDQQVTIVNEHRSCGMSIGEFVKCRVL